MQLPTSTVPGTTTAAAIMSLYDIGEPVYRVHFDVTPSAYYGATRAMVTVGGDVSGLTLYRTSSGIAFHSTALDPDDWPPFVAPLISEATRICRELGWIIPATAA